MDYLLVLLFGALTVGFMIKHHIQFTSPKVEEESEEDIAWRTHPGEF